MLFLRLYKIYYNARKTSIITDEDNVPKSCYIEGYIIDLDIQTNTQNVTERDVKQ